MFRRRIWNFYHDFLTQVHAIGFPGQIRLVEHQLPDPIKILDFPYPYCWHFLLLSTLPFPSKSAPLQVNLAILSANHNHFERHTSEEQHTILRAEKTWNTTRKGTRFLFYDFDFSKNSMWPIIIVAICSDYPHKNCDKHQKYQTVFLLRSWFGQRKDCLHNRLNDKENIKARMIRSKESGFGWEVSE